MRTILTWLAEAHIADWYRERDGVKFRRYAYRSGAWPGLSPKTIINAQIIARTLDRMNKITVDNTTTLCNDG